MMLNQSRLCHLTTLVAIATFAVVLCARRAAARQVEPLRLNADQPQLFIDDYLIDEKQGLKRTLHQPDDVPANPVILPEHPWEHRRIPYGSVWYDAELGKFRCWYLTLNIYDSRPGFRGYRKQHHVPIHEAAYLCYAESEDGIRWRKPELGLHEFRSSKNNNILLTCLGTHFDSTSVMHTPHDRERPWKMISFIGLWPYKQDLIKQQWGDTKFGITQAGHYGWSSKDGIHWQPMNDGRPVLRASDRSMFWWDSKQALYVGAAKSSLNRKRAQLYATSPDAINWTRTTDWIHTADERDHPGDEAEAAYGFRYGDQYVGFCEMRRVRRGAPVTINWELMTSRDGRNWKRPIRELFFADGPEQSWRHQVFKIFASPPIERDGKLWIYYGGKTGTVSVEEGTEPFQALCVATMRKDGFVSLDADESGGHLVTKPLVAVGKQLRLNVAVHDGGHAKVALLDEDGTPLPGFDLANSRAITSDGLDQLVSWSSGSDISKLAGQTVRLRIDLSDARLYALEFRKVPSPLDGGRASSGATP
ncbi:MAG TPA: hypothetical protein QF564_24765 [Pirellulaceae bacterium]|nr:hypothetical protein [Pirellulaceae bacterium]